MAIGKGHVRFLFYSKRYGVSFEDTLTLGRLFLYATQNEIKKNIDFFKNNVKNISDVSFKDKFAEPFFQILGAERVDSRSTFVCALMTIAV